jgi:N-methylhydantoinase A
MEDQEPIRIGIDVGGTHTDLIAVRNERMVRAKALTTHGQYSEGILDTVAQAADQFGLSTEDLLRDHTTAFVNGNTIVTNAITELKGCKVGVLVTKGFTDVLYMGRGNRSNNPDDHNQPNLPRVVSRELIAEISERIDSEGNIVAQIDKEDVQNAVRSLVKKGAEAIAICFLWSPSNDIHERKAESWVREVAPELFVSTSVSISSVFREFDRWITAVLNCYVQPPVKNFVDTVVGALRDKGYQREVEFFNGLGGVLSEDEVNSFPIQLYSSGPAGGAIGSAALAKRYKTEQVLCGDMGGTSFDTTMINGEMPSVAQRCKIGAFETGLSLLDIVSIGAGGGSLVTLDARGVPKVGPGSAGSIPGPVCYGQGGTQPTVTDCMVTMGFIDPGNYLGGRVQLDAKSSSEAIKKILGDPLGWDAPRAAAGAYTLAVVNMANALREVSIKRGYDVRTATFVAYGGALPLFASDIARDVGSPSVVIPGQSSAFSAYGLLEADYVRRESVTLGWTIEKRDGADAAVSQRDELEERVRGAIAKAGFSNVPIRLIHGASFRYGGQLNDNYMAIEPSDLTSEGLREKFDTFYETEFGEGTAWREAPLQLINYSIMGVAERPKPTIRALPVSPRDASAALTGSRQIFVPTSLEWTEIPTFDADLTAPGMGFEGPGIIDVRDTTIYVPEGSRIERDEFMNFRITLGQR